MRDPSPDRPPEHNGGTASARPLSLQWLGQGWAARSPRFISLVLVAAGVLPPVGLAALPGGLAMLGAPRTGIVLVATLLFAPALVGFGVALQGFDTVLARLRAGAGGEHRQIIARVFLGALILAYVFGLLAARPDDSAIAPCLVIGSLNLAAAWLFLLNVILEPRRSVLRQYAALISDLALLSVLLAAGGALTAALAPVYLYIAISHAEHHGRRALVWAIGLSLLGFAAVAMLSPFWEGEQLLVIGMLAAIVLLPAYVGALLHRLGTAKDQAERSNAAKNRFLAAFGEDLRGPLRTIARAGAAIDRAALEPEQWDMIARMRLSARAMLLQLDDVLNYVRIDDGSFAPETRSFDLYRLANGAVAALRATAAERGIVLALRIDPQLPYQLRGWPHQLRQILICLITNAVGQSGKVKVRINLDATELDTDRVMVRLAVTSGLLDNLLETADEAEFGDKSGRQFGLAVVDRLVRLMGGRLAVDADPRRGLSLAVELPFQIDQASQTLPLDLAHLPVLIVTKDAEFVGDLIAPLESWRAEPRWIGTGENALAYLEALQPSGRRPALMVDGRGDVLQALSWAHRAVAIRTPEPPYVLFIADEPRIDSVIGLVDDELDGILPAPFTAEALRSALHALRVEPADWFLADPTLSSIVEDKRPRRVAPVIEEPPPRRAALRRQAEELAEESPPPRPQPTPAAAPKRHRHILIAASNAANRRIMQSILGRAGHAVHLAETAEEARQILEAREIDVLLFDLTGAPGANYEAARLCRRSRPSLTIIALTGDAPAEAERRAAEVGLDAVLPKPLEPSRLLAAIKTALEGEAETAEPPPQPGPRGVVTELASHPRFEAAASASDDHPTNAARLLGHGSEFFQGVIDSFRTDSRRIVADLAEAVATADPQAFDDALQALRHCTANFGVSGLRDLLQSMRSPTPGALRRHGADYVQRLEFELTKLDAVLIDYLKTAK
jgi:signal transduction histidine kinase/DNA-binding response OmpR family regulator